MIGEKHVKKPGKSEQYAEDYCNQNGRFSKTLTEKVLKNDQNSELDYKWLPNRASRISASFSISANKPSISGSL